MSEKQNHWHGRGQIPIFIEDLDSNLEYPSWMADMYETLS